MEKKNNKCNPKIEGTHRWSEPDYKYPLMCLDCYILITWVMKLSKLKRPLYTIEDMRHLNREQIGEFWKKITYEEARLIMNEIEIYKYLWQMVNGNIDEAERLRKTWPSTSKEIY